MSHFTNNVRNQILLTKDSLNVLRVICTRSGEQEKPTCQARDFTELDVEGTSRNNGIKIVINKDRNHDYACYRQKHQIAEDRELKIEEEKVRTKRNVSRCNKLK
jgi:hypothetical protein